MRRSGVIARGGLATSGEEFGINTLPEFWPTDNLFFNLALKKMDISGTRVLVVEDDELVAMLVEAMLSDLGCDMRGLSRSVPEAIEAIGTLQMDVALLDVNLAGQQVFPVADILIQREIPIIFSSGYGTTGVPEQDRTAPVIPKPFTLQELEAALRVVSDNMSSEMCAHQIALGS